MRTLLALLFCLSWNSNAGAIDFRAESFSIKDLSEIEIRVADNASDGCWTSIRTTKASLGDKLDLAGVDVVEQSAIRILMEVNSSRTRSVFIPRFGWREGRCFGSARMILYRKPLPLDGNNPLHVFMMTDTTFTGYPNTNELVFEMIDNFIRDLKE